MSDKLKTILIFVSFLLLYFAFRSAELDVTEAIPLDGGALYSPNHMLSRPIANVVWKISKAAGYEGRSVYVLQILNVFYGAMAVAIAFVAYRKLGATSWAALAGCVLLGTSFIFWYESTDAYYIVLSGMFSAAAFLCSAILIQKPSLSTAFLLGVFFACATLSWQATVLLFPVFLWPLRHRFKELMMFGVTSIVILILIYIAAGIAQGNTTAKQLVYWATHHGGANIPWWGKFEISRILLTVISAIQSIQIYAPHWLVDFIRSTNHHEPRSIAAGVICLILLGIAILIRGIQIVVDRNFRLIWLLSGYLIIFAFLVWWEPGDLKNFFVPNIFLCAFASVVFSSWKPLPFTKVLVFTAIVVMALMTFCFTIWPRHSDCGINMRKAECVYHNVTNKDKVISTDWNFSSELLYFYQIRTVQIVSLGAYFQDHGKLIDHLYKEVEKTQNDGGKVFIVDPNSYPPDYLKWLSEQTTFSPADFERFLGKFAFQCEDLKYREVTSLQR
ncbi:glycosyltransferase family 39 protein [bacterium]|nr:glycosyltransferase family 39 protein [bacterium]